jgi:hypothetical protein
VREGAKATNRPRIAAISDRRILTTDCTDHTDQIDDQTRGMLIAHEANWREAEQLDVLFVLSV